MYRVNNTEEPPVYTYYCDRCGRHIGVSNEEKPKEIGLFKYSFPIGNEVYYMNKHLCNRCRYEMERKVGEALLSIGFKQDRYNNEGIAS